MAGGVLCLEFSGSILGICVLRTQRGALPFLVYNCVNQYENLVSVHDVTDSADLGDFLFLDFGPVFGSAYATWRLFLRPSLTSLLRRGELFTYWITLDIWFFLG